jgi:hypothetical protein
MKMENSKGLEGLLKIPKQNRAQKDNMNIV